MKTALLPIYEAKFWFSRGYFTTLEYYHTSADPKIFDHKYEIPNEILCKDFPQGVSKSKLPGVKAKSSETLTSYYISIVRILELCTLAILMPLENPYTVPHLKALISGQKFWGRKSCGSSLRGRSHST